MFAKRWGGLGPKARPFLDQESCKGSASHEGADTLATVVGELADKRCRDKKAVSTLRKFEWFMSFALVAIGSWPSTTLLLVVVLIVLKEVESGGFTKLRASFGQR